MKMKDDTTYSKAETSFIWMNMGVYFVHIRFRIGNIIIQDIPQEK